MNNVSYVPLDYPICGLDQYSVINSKDLLLEIFDSCYSNGDLRASWIGPGIPKTDCNHNMHSSPILPITYWSTWALEHWAMYYGFLTDLRDVELNTRILDFGSGVGFNTINLSHIFKNATLDAMDLDFCAVEFSKKFNHNERIYYFVGDVIEANISEKYNYIFALEILEHIDSTFHLQFIDKCLNLLKPNGKLFISTPNEPDAIDAKTNRGHIGMLNRERALQLFDQYNSNIVDFGFYDNRLLKTGDPKQFIINGGIKDFDREDGVNRSHYKITMAKV